MGLFWSGRRVLVTGGAGFVGSHVADALLAAGAHVTILDNFSTGFRQLVPEDGRVLIEGDLLDTAIVDRAVRGTDFVFHLAANADIKDGLLHPRRDVEQNIIATQNVLEAMRAHGVKEIAFSSTGSVYGESEVLPTPEDAPFPVQTSLYATSKVAAEGLLSSYAGGYGFSVFIYRFVSLLGPRYSHGHVIDFYRQLKEHPEYLDILGNGQQKKSYLHITDCVRAMFQAVEHSKNESRIHIYNLGHSDWIEVRDSAAVICRELGLTPEVRFGGGVRGWIGDSPKILLDTKRIRGLGWEPARSLEESITDTVRDFVRNPFLLRS